MTDTFRKEYRELSQLEKDDIFMMKDKAQALLDEIDLISLKENTDKRALALARTNLEQAVMWVVKAIT